MLQWYKCGAAYKDRERSAFPILFLLLSDAEVLEDIV